MQFHALCQMKTDNGPVVAKPITQLIFCNWGHLTKRKKSYAKAD